MAGMGHTAETHARAYKKTRERREKWFQENGPCQFCGSWERLELDHIDPTEKAKPGDHGVWSWSAERRADELKKCRALCHECHKARHDELHKRPHGAAGYIDRKCRCEICVEWKRQALRRETRRQGRKFREPRARRTVSHLTANEASVGNTGATGFDSPALGQS